MSSKISALTAISSVQTDDLLPVVDVHDTSMASTGTTKSITLAQVAAVRAPDYAPTGLTGATAASRYVGATASGAPASGTFVVGDFTIDQAGKVWICTSAGTPGTWAQAGATLDATAADIQPLGVQTAGAIGKGADAGHVHPYEPWQFLPESYGAKGDVRLVSDAAITSGQHQLTSASAAFTSGDAGKTVYVVGAGAAGADLLTTVSTYTNATTVQLTATAGTTVSAKGCVIATDDTAAVKSAYAAAHSYALADPSRRAQVVLSKLYCTSGAPTVGGGTLGNAVIPLTIVNPSTTAKIRIEWVGLSADAADLAHWLQPAPQMSGPGLACLRLDGTNDATNGPASIIGGPYNGYGGGTVSNVQLVIENVSFYVPFNSTYCGVDTWGMAETYAPNMKCMALGIVPSGGAWPQLNQSSITNQYTFGLRMPNFNNNDRCDIGQYSCEGLCYGFVPSEHTMWDTARAIYCVIGAELRSGGANMPHGLHGINLSAEICAQAVGVYGTDGSTVNAVIQMVDLESSGSLYDNSNLYRGYIGVLWNDSGNPGYGGVPPTGASHARLIYLLQATGPVASPQAPPATTVAWANQYYRDAEITLSVSGGTLSALKTDAVSESLPASCTLYKFSVPSGHSYTPTYTGTLSHTVKLF